MIQSGLGLPQEDRLKARVAEKQLPPQRAASEEKAITDLIVYRGSIIRYDTVVSPMFNTSCHGIPSLEKYVPVCRLTSRVPEASVMRIDQELRIVWYMNSKPDGIPIVVSAERINPLSINLARVVIKVL